MENALTIKDNGEIVNMEDYAMSVDGLVKQVNLIQEVMEKTMKEEEHYGTIPGTKKPTLYKPGAEKLCLTFRLDPHYEILREIRETTFIAYTVRCDLNWIPTGQHMASGIGSCNSKETKYRYRYVEESTGVPIPKKYWDAKNAGDSKEMKRLLQIPNMDSNNLRAAKIDGQWVIAKAEQIENDNPWDLDNTLIKMACKRALVAATLNATAASDIFTQDIEDMPSDIITGKPPQKPQAASESKKKKTENGNGKSKIQRNKEVREQLEGLMTKNPEKFIEVLTLHECSTLGDVLNCEPEAQQAILKDLEKAIA